MTLTTGTCLGPYEIVAPLGSGGMGEVYKARDTRLDRMVAVKILPTALAGDAEARARFEREARAIAALDHPHICAVYDVGEDGGVHYLVMQHLDGETLAARIARTQGPLPLDQVLTIGVALADALDKTHRAGITHRDLKPGNIMLTRVGAKLLDFGLAKLRGPSAPISMSDMTGLTAATPATARGTILGTVPYLAPEQVEGRDADARSDIWAFGALLYEMAAGQRPFQGDSPASVIGAILKDHPPPLSARQPLAPRTLDLLVDRCLAKDPDERWQSIGDVKHQLAAIAATSATVGGSTPGHQSQRISRWVAAAGALGLSAAIGALAVSWSGARRPVEALAQPPVRLALDLGGAVPFAGGVPVVALSPDGTRFVFVSTGPDRVAHLFTRRFDQLEATPLPGTEGAYAPFFAPDGMSVGFFAVGTLKKTRLDGGSPVVLCDAPAGRGASWSEDGTIVAALDQRRGLSVVSSTGGGVKPLTELSPGEITHRWPQVLPGGKAVIFTVNSVPGNFAAASIAVASLENNGEEARRIVLANVGMAPRYLTTGHLAYVANGTLYAVPFDVDRLEVRGAAVPVLDDLSDAVSFGSAHFDFSKSGTALYKNGRRSGRAVIQWLKRDGTTESLWSEPDFYQYPKLSPDGSRLAVVVDEGANSDIWVYDWLRGSKTRLTTDTRVDTNPIWSPDGQHVVFQSAEQLYAVRADGAEPPQPLTPPAPTRFPTSFTPDGGTLLFYELTPAGGSLIKSLPIEHESGRLRGGTPQLLRESSASNPAPTISPDGRWVAFSSTDSGTYEVYVRAFPDDGRQWPISAGGGSTPIWSRTGPDLYYRTDDQVLMAAAYTVNGHSFAAGKPRIWSETRLFATGLTQNFDIASDGQRFAVLMAAEGPEQAGTKGQTILVLNLFDQVRRALAAGRE